LPTKKDDHAIAFKLSKNHYKSTNLSFSILLSSLGSRSAKFLTHNQNIA
jgi:hypothetical protein